MHTFTVNVNLPGHLTLQASTADGSTLDCSSSVRGLTFHPFIIKK